MKAMLIALWFLLVIVEPALADCSTQQVSGQDGRIYSCTTCCYFGSCNTNCY
jgi:hypothetical protein